MFDQRGGRVLTFENAHSLNTHRYLVWEGDGNGMGGEEGPLSPNPLLAPAPCLLMIAWSDEHTEPHHPLVITFFITIIHPSHHPPHHHLHQQPPHHHRNSELLLTISFWSAVLVSWCKFYVVFAFVFVFVFVFVFAFALVFSP